MAVARRLEQVSVDWTQRVVCMHGGSCVRFEIIDHKNSYKINDDIKFYKEIDIMLHGIRISQEIEMVQKIFMMKIGIY